VLDSLFKVSKSSTDALKIEHSRILDGLASICLPDEEPHFPSKPNRILL